MEARELMTERPVTVTPETTIRKALVLLHRGRYRHLPVLRRGRLWGVVSDRDLQRALAGGADADDPVAALVRHPAITAAPDTPVEELTRLLLDNKIGCLPIVWGAGSAGDGAGEMLVGIVTESDVFRAVIRALGVLEPGSRLAVRLEDPCRDLGPVARVLAEHGAPLLAVSTTPLPPDPAAVPERPGLRLLLRLGPIDPWPLAAALAGAGLVVERAVPPAPPAVLPAGRQAGGG
jgi:acetoin utilization protein AcuB